MPRWLLLNLFEVFLLVGHKKELLSFNSLGKKKIRGRPRDESFVGLSRKFCKM